VIVAESLRERVEALYAEYVAAIDDAIERWPEFFTADALYKIVTRENFDRGLPLALMRCEGRGMILDRVVAITKTSVYVPRRMRHIVSAIRPARQGDATIECSSHFAVFESFGEETTRLFTAGRSFDRIVEIDNSLNFKERIVVLDGDLIEGSLIYPI
jgi:anthranilate 1,2-dioxygenase small subunit